MTAYFLYHRSTKCTSSYWRVTMHSIAVVRITSGDYRRSISFADVNGYISLPITISHSDDDWSSGVGGEYVGANRVIELDNDSTQQYCCARYVGGFLLASELPNEVGQQQGCSQPTRVVSDHLTRRKDQGHDLVGKFSKAACFRKLQPPSHVGVSSEA